MENRYQEALDNLLHCKHNSLTCKKCNHKDRCTIERDSKTIQEVINKYSKLQEENNQLKYDVIDFQERYKEESKYSGELFKENKMQKEILAILKPYVKVRCDVKRVPVYRIVFNIDGCVVCPDTDKEQYELLREWKAND